MSHLKCIKPQPLLTAITFLMMSSNCYAFEIYVNLPYRELPSSSQPQNSLTKIYNDHNIKKINLIYDDRLLTMPVHSTDKKDALVAPQKIYSAANKDFHHRDSLVSLDLESWNRFDAQTPAKIVNVLRAYRTASPNAVIGLYATVPQNTYKWDPAKVSFYNKMNKQYTDVAYEVDYFSPSLYNYSGKDFPNWLEGAKYNVIAAKKYSTKKKVIPYITPEVFDDGITSWLSYDEMLMRLKALDALGVDGCIIWGSSQSRNTLGRKPVLDPESGWFKAVLDFSKMQNR
ncbi:hypothetical protein [Pseudomonas entomophila]|uniref:hypothetical protein n=1 Tax=Pseudomonas entomophila TaxID=312306 RepID=UPI003EBCA292